MDTGTDMIDDVDDPLRGARGILRGQLWGFLAWAIIITCLSFLLLLNGCVPRVELRPVPGVETSPDYAQMIQDFVNAEWEDGEPYAVYSIEFYRVQSIPQGKGMYLYYTVIISHGPELINCMAAFWVLTADESHPQLRGVHPVETKRGI